MSNDKFNLVFSLDGYNHRATIDELLRRHLPFRLRNAHVIRWIMVFLVSALAFLAPQLGYRIPSSLFFAMAALALLIILFQARERSVLIRRALSDLFRRRGVIQLSTDDEGLTLTSEIDRVTLFWAQIDDVILSRDGLLILSGPLAFYPVSAKAFKDPGHQRAMLDFAKAKIREKRGLSS